MGTDSIARGETLTPQATALSALNPAVNANIPTIPAILQSLACARHLLEMFRRQLSDEKTRRKLHRLDKRLFAVASELHSLNTPEK